MDTITLAGLAFGGGRTRICVPLTAPALPELERELAAAARMPADLYEWRADHFTGPSSQALALLRGSARPVLATLRTKPQGGRLSLAPEEYEARLLEMLDDGEAPAFGLIDIELCCGRARAGRLVRAARRRGLGVVVSQHDFERTPAREEMLAVLAEMRGLGADLPKLAVTPRSPEDVLALLSATCEAGREGPVVTMSMGRLGRVSRVSGGLTGSCLTFAAGVRPSAPGQLPAEELRRILDALEG